MELTRFAGHFQRSGKAVPLEFRREMVGLVRWGRSPEALARDFEPSAGAIRNWVKQADLDEGRRADGLTTKERREMILQTGESGFGSSGTS